LTTLTRRYRFSAAHVLARRDWSASKNREVYGKCANPAGHGHNYGLEVSVKGEPDPATGMLIEVGCLDRLVEERVVSVLDRRLLNRDVPAFASQVPTAENIARYAWQALEGRVGPARLHRIRLVETPNNTVEYRGGEAVGEGA
jgi:6-pyruvoyltetrahydropterin/6-carboxytetrahydropterin synthase